MPGQVFCRSHFPGCTQGEPPPGSCVRSGAIVSSDLERHTVFLLIPARILYAVPLFLLAYSCHDPELIWLKRYSAQRRMIGFLADR
jgi:hypothetical protein